MNTIGAVPDLARIPISELLSPTVYRLYSADGRLLYVGQSSLVGSRLASHRFQNWWGEVASVSLERCPADELNRREALAIEREQPLYNKGGRPRQMALWPRRALDRTRKPDRTELRLVYDEMLRVMSGEPS